MNLNFKSFLLLFLSGLYSITITVGSDPSDDYTTIQEGIDAASDGDIVLVGDGTYNENIIIESEIILTSTGGHQSTIIDGSGGAAGTMSSTVTVRPESGSAVIPQDVEIDGFTITGGIGNLMDIMVDDSDTRTVVTRRVGGGIMAFNTSPEIKNNNIKDNGNASTANGGGIIAIDSAEDWSFNDRDWEYNPELPPITEGLDFSNNIFYGNSAIDGNSIFIDGFEDFSTDLSNGIFDCYSIEYQDVSEYWVKGELTEFNFEGSEGIEPIYTDVWVNPETGVNQGNTIGDEEHPFKTINFAIGMIYATENHPITIHLASGTYTPDNGEIFPIIMTDYLSIEGVVESNNNSLPRIDAMGTNRVITMIGCIGNSISNVVIENGYFGGEDLCDNNMSCLGGGLYLKYSNPTLYNVEFYNNYAYYGGGGIYMENSQPNLFEVDITKNHSSHGDGGGIFMADHSNALMSNMRFVSNYGEDGAALRIIDSSPVITNITIEASNTGHLGYNNFSGTAVLVQGNDGWDGGGALLRNIAMANNANYTALYLINANLINATIAQNLGAGLNLAPSASGNNIIEYNNGGDSYCGCIGCYSGGGNFQIDHSSFTLNGACEECPHYCDCIGGSECSIDYNFIDNIINFNPLLTNPGSYNYTLLPGSPCIDTGEQYYFSHLNLDIDGTPTDMGYHGGSFIHFDPDINFGDVGNSEVSKNFTMFNYRETPITIDSVSFTAAGPNGEVLTDGEIFSSDALFPLTINPLETGIIQVDCLIPESYSHQSVNGEMTLYSNELPNGLALYLQASHSDYDQSLNGVLSGNLPASIYNIAGDIYINAGDTLHISPGTEFIFQGDFGLYVQGTLKAQGTEQDSIIFNLNAGGTKGIHFYNVTDATELDYVKIFGVQYSDYSPMDMINSNPKISNILLTENGAGPGISMVQSSPEISNLTFNGNMTTAAFSLEDNSSPILNNINIVNNTGGGSFLKTGWSDGSEVMINNMLIENNLIIENNNDVTHGIYVTNNFMIDNIIIRNNTWDSTYPGTAIVTSGGQGSISNAIIENNSMDGLHVSDQTTLNNISVKNNGGSGIVLAGDVSISNAIITGNGTNSEAVYQTCIDNCIEVGASGECPLWGGSGHCACNCIYNTSGGGIYIYGGVPSLINVTIADNVFAEEVQGGGIYFSHNGNFIVNNEPTIINSIIYNNYPYNFDENFQDMGPEPETYNFPSFLHSDVEGSLLEHWENLGGNIESDPLFINSNNGNFNLSSNSPCIDAGTADINGDGQSDITDYLGSAPDMGAFEYIPNQQNGDLNGDGSVNIIDIVALVNIILNDLDPEGADYNGDGTVNVIDVVALVQFVLNN